MRTTINQAATSETQSLSTRAVELSIHENGVGFVSIAVPGENMNIINLQFMEDMADILSRAEERVAPGLPADRRLTSMVIHSTKPGAFLAGADLKLIRSAATREEAQAGARQLQSLCDRLERLPVATVAAIDGAALGGGLEVALACDFRVAAESRSRTIGLVEVQLGLIPAGGGTQRLARLVGISKALTLILSSRRLTPAQARRMGIVDQVVHPAVLLQAAVSIARRPPRSASRPRARLDILLESTPVGRSFIYRTAAKGIRQKSGIRYRAPFLALDAVRTGREDSWEQGLETEATDFGTLAVTATTRNLIDIFLDSNELKREQAGTIGGEHDMKTVGVVGAGLMGSGIAQAAAMNGLTVRLRDVSDEAVSRGLKQIRTLVGQARRSRRLDRYEESGVLNRVSGSPTYSGFGRADLVVEAAPEDLALKRRIVSDLEAILRDEAIIGTNTSALPIRDIASEATHPERIVGIHFFSPVHRMPLVEVVRGPRTSETAIVSAVQFGHRLDKHVIVVTDGPGFYTTRVLGFMIGEALRAFEDGARVEDIDAAMVEFGFPTGPLTLMDEVGFDVALHVAETLALAFPDRLTQSQVVTALRGSGRQGRKGNLGFYRYGKKGKSVDQSIHDLRRPPGRMVGRSEIQERLSLIFVNEAARCLSDGVIACARDGDLGAVFGLGFPPFLGGPFRYVDTVGVTHVNERLRLLAGLHGERFSPAPALAGAEATGSMLRPSSRGANDEVKRSPMGEIVGLREAPVNA